MSKAKKFLQKLKKHLKESGKQMQETLNGWKSIEERLRKKAEKG